MVTSLLVSAGVSGSPIPTTHKNDDGNSTNVLVQRLLNKLPLYFTENRGQLESRIAYYSHGRDVSVYFMNTGITYVIRERGNENVPAVVVDGGRQVPEPVVRRSWRVELEFIGSRQVRPRAEQPTPTQISFFKGPQKQWRTGLSTYQRIVYHDLWPGIDLVFMGAAESLKHQFEVAPGADPRAIRIAVHGAENLRINNSGELEFKTPMGPLIDGRPVVFQERDGFIDPVEADFDLQPAKAGTATYGFSLGDYDTKNKLIIDPVTFIYTAFIGSSAYDAAGALVLDADGNIYITGVSAPAVDFTTVGPLDDSYNGGDYDIFVAKISADGSTIMWAGYVGGFGGETSGGIALDSDNNVYITGSTRCTESTFPVTIGPDLTHNSPTNPATKDGFVAKIRADGTALVYCGYIGGSEMEEGDEIVVDDQGRAYVTGWTQADQTTFPAFGALDSTYNGNGDIFIARVRADGTALEWSTFFGGSQSEYPSGIFLDGAGSLYLSGYTYSTQSTFPVVIGPDLTFNGGLTDAFVSKLDSDCTTVLASGYIGGSEYDNLQAMAVNDDGSILIAGHTQSTQPSFPVSGGPDLTHNGNFDAWVGKVKADFSGLDFLGFIGGSANDMCYGLDVDPAGNIHVVGETYSDETTFPVLIGPDLTKATGWDGWVAQVKPDGSGLDHCGYLGGTGWDCTNDIKIDPFGDAFVTGRAASAPPSFSGPTTSDLPHNGDTDAFVAKLGFCGHSLDLIAGQWSLISLPCQPGDTVEALFGDDGLGTYGVDWAMIERDETSDSYHQLLITEPITQGAGYWIKVLSGTPAINVAASQPDHSQDFVVTLTEDTEPGRWNLLGHPFGFDVNWADVKVYDVVGEVEYTIAENEAGNFINNRTMFKWNGGSYQSYHPQSNPGSLEVYDGFWVRVKDQAEVRIPASPAATKKQPLPSQTAESWWVQLVIEGDALEDPGNRLGRFANATDSLDEYDLEELKPFSAPFLTMVFPHPEWQTAAWSFTTDFRQSRDNAGGRWEFEMKSDIPRLVTLSWQGEGPRYDEILSRSLLQDIEYDETIDVVTQSSYTFMMVGTVHRFFWSVNSLPSIDAGPNHKVIVDQELIISANYFDEDLNDSHSATLSWGDGQTENGSVDSVTRTISGAHTYVCPGTLSVEICIEDSFEEQACDSMQVEVRGTDIFSSGFELGDTTNWSAVAQ